MAHQPVDGTLLRWDEVPDAGWRTLLLGNGLSINISSEFAYDSLHEEALRSGSLKRKDRAVFDGFETTNFEVVLDKLRDGAHLAEILGRNPQPYQLRFRSVQKALGTAVRGVHLDRLEVPDASLEAIKAELGECRQIFTTSYDLILYWAIGYNDDFRWFCDCFWSNGRNEFDSENCEVFAGWTPVYYMHGALHLIVGGDGATRKLTRDNRTLLDQFGEPIPGDPDARPLLITEASSRDKLSEIRDNDYLAHAYETLQALDDPLMVFGHSLGDQDQHLIDAINENPDRPVAISMTLKKPEDLRVDQGRICGKLRVDPDKLYFYDAATHPLGSPKLTKKRRTRFRRLQLRSRPATTPTGAE